MKAACEKQRALDWIEKHREEIVEGFQSLVRIPSLTGEEGACQNFMAEQLRAMGVEPDIFEPDIRQLFADYPRIAQYPTRWEPELDLVLRFPDICTREQLENSGYANRLNYRGRPNVVGTLKGAGGGRSLILNGHIDVVTVGDESNWQHEPFGAELVDGQIYGRGACDMKGGLWACTKAMEAFVRCGIKLRGDLILQSVVNEEHSGNGTLACVARGYRADAAICAEPTGSRQFAVHTGGGIYWEITVIGRETHTGARWREGQMLGVSAIEKMALLICALREQEREANREGVRLSLGVGLIRGGSYATSTAPECTVSGVVYFSTKFGTGEDGVERVKNLFREAVSREAQKDPWLAEHRPELSFLHYDDAYRYPSGSDFLNYLRRSMEQTLGCRPQAMKFSACDARHLGNRGEIPTIVYGPGDVGVAHSVDEHIDVEELIEAVKVIAATAYDWCS